MFKFVLFNLAVSVLAAPPQSVVPLEEQQSTVIPIVSQSDELEPNGTYHFSYETGNGIKRDEIAYEKVVPRARSGESNEGGEDDSGSDEIHVQQGSYSYTGPDGKVYSVRYIADENGFQPIGDHIPRVPENIQISSSAEKSGRALKSHDSAESASSPKQVGAVVPPPKNPLESKQVESVQTGAPAVDSDAKSSLKQEALVQTLAKSAPTNPESSSTESASPSESSSDSNASEKLASPGVPEEISSPAPEEVSSAAPEQISTVTPEEVSTATEKISTVAPAEVTTAVSEEISSAAPEETSTAVPAPSGEVSTPAPIDVSTEGSGDASTALTEQTTLTAV